MGVYMGIFNFFIVIPQLVAVSLLGVLLKLFFGSQPLYALVIGGVSLLVAGLCVLRVREPASHVAAATANP
jgi:maltose/moltooligosaccharide transporter